jgi:hypothetical protein
MTHPAATDGCEEDTSMTAAAVTKGLLACGAVAGPFYVVVGLAQALTRPGFDLARHDLSLLANGSLGWIQISNLILTGLLVLAGAVGIRRALATGPGRTWGPLLVGVYGAGMISAGVFVADPALGFPPGTPDNANTVSWHGLLHLLSAAIGFLSLIAGCMVLARRFAAGGLRAWSGFSIVAGVLFLAGFLGLAVGQHSSWAILGFWIGLLVVWAWLSATTARLALRGAER